MTNSFVDIEKRAFTNVWIDEAPLYESHRWQPKRGLPENDILIRGITEKFQKLSQTNWYFSASITTDLISQQVKWWEQNQPERIIHFFSFTYPTRKDSTLEICNSSIQFWKEILLATSEGQGVTLIAAERRDALPDIKKQLDNYCSEDDKDMDIRWINASNAKNEYETLRALKTENPIT